jgi:hypothetical protein
LQNVAALGAVGLALVLSFSDVWAGDPTYVIVRVKGGRGVIEDLYVKDKPIGDFLAAEAANWHAPKDKQR